jgi:adenylate cyclase
MEALAPGSALSSPQGHMTATRRLAAILVADVVGYSRLIGLDEGGTLRALKTIRLEVFDPAIAAHNGRLVKTTGDGLLLEFGSVVDALRCAIQVRGQLAERNENLPADKRIEFRIGIHQGDVVVEDGELFGDGVNIAVRLEGLAEPGGICVSARVQEDAAGKLDVMFQDLGEQQLKNITRTTRVYALRREAVADLVVPRVTSVSTIAQPRVAPRLSIVVLPFANLSDDREQRYFADGITEDLTTDLSRIAGIFVISRNTAFTYRNKPVETKQIGRELQVRYVLEGSIRRSGNQVRINAQLIDAETDAHLWAERLDSMMGDLFSLQNEITSRIAVALNLELVRLEAARSINNPDAFDYVLRGRAALSRRPTTASYSEAVELFESALALDPLSVEAQSLLATVLANRVLNHMTETTGTDLKRAERLVAHALDASTRSSPVHYAKGQLLRAQDRHQEAIPEYETALALDRNCVAALAALGECKLYMGDIEEVIPLQEQAIRLSPRDPLIAVWYFWIGQAHLIQSRVGEAILWFEKARRANPELPYIHSHLAAAYGLKGDAEGAAAELAEARRLRGDRYASIANIRASDTSGPRKIRALYEAVLFTGLRKAGMPEE